MNHLYQSIKRRLTSLLCPQYRLTVYYHGTALPENTYAPSERLLRKKISTLHGTACWMLYRRGPLGLPEREIDFDTYRP